LAYDPFRTSVSYLVGEPDVLQIPVSLHINRKRISDRALAKIFKVFNGIADEVDHEIIEDYWNYFPSVRDQRELAHRKISELGLRLLIVDVSQGSVILTGSLLLGAVWVLRNVVGDGWKQSQTKHALDDAVARIIDHAAERVVSHLKRHAPLSRLLMREPLILPHQKGKGIQIIFDEYPKLEYRLEDKSRD